jgi:hypothetical protein
VALYMHAGACILPLHIQWKARLGGTRKRTLFHPAGTFGGMKKTPALKVIKPRPTRCHRIEDPEHVPGLRRIDCRAYDACLDVAATKDWRGFHCNDCGAYEPQTRAEARRDYFATLELLAETQLLPALVDPASAADVFEDEDESGGSERFGFADEAGHA